MCKAGECKAEKCTVVVALSGLKVESLQQPNKCKQKMPNLLVRVSLGLQPGQLGLQPGQPGPPS